MTKTQSGLSRNQLGIVRKAVPAFVPPVAGEVVQEGWWETYALPRIDGMDDVAAVTDDVDRLAALAKYVKDRKLRFEYDAARIVGEVRIGELLGPAPPGSPTVEPVQSLRPEHRVWFRKLADHRPLVLRALKDGIASRKRILAKIDADALERPERSGIELRRGDFREVLDDLDGTVDAIITDPPYPREFLPLYADLSTVAARVLRPGGIVAAMVGQSYLPDVMAGLGTALEYRWTMAYLTGGAATALHARRLQSYWKPVLIYEKPPVDADHRIGGDVIRSGGNDRDDTEHHWGQTESGMAAIVERLTTPGTFVLDPFAGGGTTLAVCADLGRPAIGVELDPDAAERAADRLGVSLA